MPNCWRFLGALPEYLFSEKQGEVYINLFTESTVVLTSSEGDPITLAVETTYPHSGTVTVKCVKGGGTLAVNLRIPGWCTNPEILIPDGARERPVSGKHFCIERVWHVGDTCTAELPMPIRVIRPDPRVDADKGRVVFARGPLVYCLESEDVDFPVEDAKVAGDVSKILDRCSVDWRDNLFGGIHMLHVPGEKGDIPLIPWFCRANRGDDSRWIIHIPTALGEM